VVVGTTEFRALARAEARARGLADLAVVTVPHPIGGIPAAQAADKAEAAWPDVLAALTARPDSAGAAAPGGVGPAGRALTHEAPGDLDACQAWVLARGWGDGLPVLPATPERVERLLGGVRRDPAEVVAVLAPRMGRATVEAVAVNAALAGAGPEHLPVVLAAVAAVAEPRFNLKAVQTTTHPCTPLVIVNGPVARRLGINAGGNALGQGARANAVIGRALRLVLQNVGGARPGVEDRATLGHPGKYAYCLAEREEASPWEPLSVERGFSPGDSTVTVCASDAPHNVNDHGSTSPEGIVVTVAGTAATVGMNNVYLGGEPLIVLGPEHAATVASAGWSKADFKRALWEAARLPLSRFGRENVERFAAIAPERFRDRPPETPVPITRRWEDLMVVVAGGAGKHSAVIPTFGSTWSVTLPVRD
jgi:hypothetical protein